MNARAIMVLRIVFGMLLVVVGSNKFFNFMTPPEVALPDAVLHYTKALMSTKTIELVGLVEVLAGFSLIINKYAGLMMIILMSVSINAVLFHMTLSPDDIYGALVLLVLNIAMLWVYRHQYKDLLKG